MYWFAHVYQRLQTPPNQAKYRPYSPFRLILASSQSLRFRPIWDEPTLSNLWTYLGSKYLQLVEVLESAAPRQNPRRHRAKKYNHRSPSITIHRAGENKYCTLLMCFVLLSHYMNYCNASKRKIQYPKVIARILSDRLQTGRDIRLKWLPNWPRHQAKMTTRLLYSPSWPLCLLDGTFACSMTRIIQNTTSQIIPTLCVPSLLTYTSLIRSRTWEQHLHPKLGIAETLSCAALLHVAYKFV